jgi:hypothetical protein
MNKYLKTFLLVAGICLIVISLLLIGSSVALKSECNSYAGESDLDLDNEYGLYSLFCLLSILSSFVTSVPWIILYINYRKNKIRIKQ